MTDSKPSVGVLCILHFCADFQNAVVHPSRNLLPFALLVIAESLEFGAGLAGLCNPSQSILSLLQLCLTAVVVHVASQLEPSCVASSRHAPHRASDEPSLDDAAGQMQADSTGGLLLAIQYSQRPTQNCETSHELLGGAALVLQREQLLPLVVVALHFLFAALAVVVLVTLMLAVLALPASNFSAAF